jgi:hypothetical protein
VLSLLWLHYTSGWDAEKLGGELLHRLFGVDVHKAFVAAKEVYPKEAVLEWMDGQRAAGN